MYKKGQILTFKRNGVTMFYKVKHNSYNLLERALEHKRKKENKRLTDFIKGEAVNTQKGGV